MFTISRRQEDLQFDRVMELLNQTYWADKRTPELVKKSIEHSACYGAYLKENGKQVGFARVITDYATSYYICDVIVDKDYRGRQIGKKLIETIVNDERLQNMRGILTTKNAHGLYRQYGFDVVDGRFMSR